MENLIRLLAAVVFALGVLGSCSDDSFDDGTSVDADSNQNRSNPVKTI
jgi:hypothetical protein